MALRAWELAQRHSFWVDELAVALNLRDRSLAQLLTQPLSLAQVAPPGFLALERLVWRVAGGGELALRSVPFAASIAALVLFARVARRALSPFSAVGAVALFAVAPPLVQYAAELKPYSLDVLAAVLVLHQWDDAPPWLAVLPWFSNASVFVLAACGVTALRRRPRAVALWAGSCALAIGAAFALTSPATREYLHAYWRNELTPSAEPFVQLFGAVVPFPRALLCVALAGAVVRPAWALPAVFALAAAAAGQVPLAPRLLLFVVPFTALLVGRIPLVAPLAAVLAVGHLPHAPRLQPVEETRPLFERLEREWRPGQSIYVYYGASLAWRYYAPRLPATLGGCHRGDTRAYFAELERLHGPTWVVLAHALGPLHEQEDLLAWLPAPERRLDTSGATAVLVTLDGPRPLPPLHAPDAGARECTGMWAP